MIHPKSKSSYLGGSAFSSPEGDKIFLELWLQDIWVRV